MICRGIAAVEQEQKRVKDKNREKREARQSRHARVRRKISGTSEIPRLCVYRSLNHIYAQIIDDNAGTTLASSSSLKLDLPPVQAESKPEAEIEGKPKGKEKVKAKAKARPEGIKIRRSRAVGKAIAEAAAAKGIKKVAFDRGGYLYHGRIAALADEARKAGLEF
jgi:large subunit ribosomal protein L18